MPSVQPVVYNQDNLVLWKLDLPKTEQEIAKSLQLIEEQRLLLGPLQDELRSVDSDTSSAQLQLTSLNISANQDRLHHLYDNHGYPHHRHHHHYEPFHVANDVVRIATIASLESELRRLRQKREGILNDMRPYETTIHQQQAHLRQANARQEWLKIHIPAAELFLQNLYTNPMESVSTLTNKLITVFSDYENSHLLGLSPQVRKSLMAVRYGLNELLVYPNGYAPDYINIEHRNNYLRLSGFIWDMYLRVKQEQQDTAFEKILGELVEETHILEDGDLPDHLRTNSSAKAWYQFNTGRTRSYLATSDQDLTSIEADLLNQWMTLLTQSSLPPSTNLQRHIINAVRLIDTEVKMKKQKQEDIDYHFYGRTVRILNEVFNNPNDKQAAKHLGDIAEHASGHTSVGKQVVGGLVIVLGVLLIAASVAGFIASFGSSSLLSAWGMALGITLLQAQIACTVTSSIFMGTGLGLTFFAGPNAIKSGKRQGLSQELIEIKEEVEHYDGPPPYSAPPIGVY